MKRAILCVCGLIAGAVFAGTPAAGKSDDWVKVEGMTREIPVPLH